MSNLMAVEHQPATHLCEKYVNLVIGASNPLLCLLSVNKKSQDETTTSK